MHIHSHMIPEMLLRLPPFLGFIHVVEVDLWDRTSNEPNLNILLPNLVLDGRICDNISNVLQSWLILVESIV